MTNNRPLLYALLVVLLAGLILAVGWAGYNLLSLAFQSTPTPTAAPTVVTVVVVATPTVSTSATTTAQPGETIIPAITPTASPAPGQAWEVVVVADLINVRTAPGLDQPVIGGVPMGTVLRPEGRTADGQWLLVCCAFGQWGWVANQAGLVALDFDWALLPVVQFPTPQPPPPAPTPTWTPWLTPLPPQPTWTPAPLPTWTPWPTWTPVPPATETPAPVEGWRGEYFTNPNLQGAPAMVRIDPAVRFNWGFGSPASLIPADNFSARWSRAVWFDAGQYRFQARVDDGVRVWLNDILIIDDWRDSSVRTITADRTLAGGWHSLRVEYYERTGEAVIDFTWEREPQVFPDWRGQYFANPTLSGQPALVRNDLQIAFDWGFGSPAPGVVPVDNFSVRWTRQLHFLYSDIYRFALRVDDGARVKIDGVVILDAWREGPATDFIVDRFVQTGTHTVEVEYFERSGSAQIFFNWSLPAPTPTWTPSWTPTATPTWTPTATSTATPTPTATATSTPTATPTATPSATATPTTSVTGTPTSTTTATSTPTVTPTATPSATATPTTSVTGTPTPTATATSTPTATPTATPTVTPTVTPSATATPTTSVTGTPTPAATSTPTATPTATPASEPTGTATPKPTATPSSTLTSEPTVTPTSTPTGEPTATPTATPASEPTGTATPKPTVTPTSTPTGEPTVTPTSTPTGEPTVTPTSTPTGEPSATPTATVTPTSPATRPTRTPTATPAIAPSIVISPTEGTVGTTIVVTGTSWLPNDRVAIALTAPLVQPAGQPRLPLRVRVDRKGNFRAAITVPADDRLLREPVLWVAATGSRGTRAIALFTMLPPDSESAPIFPITPLPPPIFGTPSPGSDG